jgi:chemotaxis methyl-accepting protein methylase
MNEQSALYQVARSIYRFLRSDLYFGLLHRPIGRAKHRALLENSPRDDAHTYTCFCRSPGQLDALAGPVIDRFLARGGKRLVINLFAASNGAEPYTIASELSYRRPQLDFTLVASELHPELVATAQQATYTMEEITQGQPVPPGFLSRTFDRWEDGRYVVKPQHRQRVSFQQADLLSPELPEKFAPADVVFAQNVLFHLRPALARQAFANLVRMVRPGGQLFLDGMELDMRVELTRQAGLEPLDYEVRRIYQDARRHVPENWWDFYYGSEPYSYLTADRTRRYCTIFEAPAC